jgi:hypothetical protein
LIAGRGSDELSKACVKAREADAAEDALIVKLRSPKVDAALKSESAFWKFLIDPSTPYIERMAAAHRGGSRVSPEQLPRLWKARAEFETLPAGVNPTPCWLTELSSWAAQRPEAWERRAEVPIVGTVSPKLETRDVLGFEIHLPQKAIDYPLAVNSRDKTPWIWQMGRALNILVPKVRQYYADPERYGSMAEVALRWHPDDHYGKLLRVEVLSDGPQTALWVRALMRLALNEVPAAGNFYAHGAGSVHLEELKHVAHVAILQQTSGFGIAGASAKVLADMATRDTYLHRVETATAVLEVGRWALNLNEPVHSRYYFLANSICRMVAEPPFKPDFRLRPNSPEQAEGLAAFEAWFTKERPRLERESAKEMAHLNDLASELNTHIAVPVIDARLLESETHERCRALSFTGPTQTKPSKGFGAS